MDSQSIIHEKKLTIEKDYYKVKASIQEKLSEWPDLYAFDDGKHQIIYKTEGPLIPEENSRIPVLILFVNPHPRSVEQGMFLSPSRMGRENPFWETLRNTGYFRADEPITPQTMIKNKYKSRFRFFMADLFPFPTENPENLQDIFGLIEYKKMIEESKDSIKRLILSRNIFNVICFGKTQYEIVINEVHRTDYYLSFFEKGKIIRNKVWFDERVNVYLTYPTAWRFAEGLKKIFDSIVADSN